MAPMRAFNGYQPTTRPGQALVIVALLFTALLGMAALAIDIGNLSLQQRNLRGIAEAAVMIGAQYYDGTNETNPVILPAGVTAVQAYLAASPHSFSCPGPDCTITHPVPAYNLSPSCPSAAFPAGCQYQYIQVTLRRTVSFSFARVFGLQSQSVQVTATARAIRPSGGIGAAVIALGTGPGDRVTVDHPLGFAQTLEYQVWGHVAAYTVLYTPKRLRVNNGNAFSATTPPFPANINPPAIVDPAVSTRFPDPFRQAELDGLVNFPDLGPLSNCRSTTVTPPPPPGPQTVVIDRSIAPYNALEDYYVPEGVTARFLPGRYCRIRVDGTAQFVTGVYRVDTQIILGDGSEAISVICTPTCSSASSSVSTNVGAADGSYIRVLGGVIASGTAHYQLKGRPEQLDVLFHIPTDGAGGALLWLRNTTPSNIIGSLYAPSHPILLWGNIYPLGHDPSLKSARVTRSQGGLSPSRRGGRVVGRQVDLLADIPAGYDTVVWGVDYPPTDEGYVFMPILVPNSP